MSEQPQRPKAQPAPMPGGPAGRPVRMRQRNQAPPQPMPGDKSPMAPSFQSEEDRDYQQAMQTAYVPEPPTQQEALGPQPQPTQPPQKAEHPLLQQLKSDLGISHHVPIEVDVGKHQWSMIPISKQFFGIASRIVEELAIGAMEKMSMIEIAMPAVSIMAIDGTPTYKVFSVETSNEVIRDPMNPPANIRVRAASALFDWLNTGARSELSSKLHSAYVDTWDKHGEVNSYLDDRERKAWTWYCSEDDCPEFVKEPPRYDGEELLPMYCRYHGKPLMVISKGEEDESPLP